MLTLDASSIVHAWDTYPIAYFPSFWGWMQRLMLEGRMVIPQPAHVEVGHVAPECQEWLNQVGIQVIPMSGGILAKAAELKKLIGVVGDNYNTKGVDENDLLVIATAITRGDHLVSDEAVQLALPSNPAKFKIPAVCQSYENGHPCTNIKGMIIQYGHMGLAAPQPAIA